MIDNFPNVKWNIGGLFSFDDFFFDISEQFKQDGQQTRIHSVFGGFPCLFNGGRNQEEFENYGENKSLEEVEAIFKQYHDYGISCRLTFSSCLIKEDELFDSLSNQVLALLEKYSLPENPNGVIVCLDILNNHIHKYYPKLITLASVTKVAIETNFQKDDANYYNNLFDRGYDYIVANSALGKDPDLKVLKEVKNKDKIEIIVNNLCMVNCPYAKGHYRLASEINRAEILGLPHPKIYVKDYIKNCGCEKFRDGSLYFSVTELDSLQKIGIDNFKLQGRDYNFFAFTTILNQYISLNYTPNLGYDLPSYFLITSTPPEGIQLPTFQVKQI